MNYKKKSVAIVIFGLIAFSLVLSACGQASPTAANTTGQVQGTPTAATTTGQTQSTPTATAVPATTAANAPAATSAPATTPAPGNKPEQSNTKLGAKATPDMIVKTFYTSIQEGDYKKDVALLSENLRTSVSKGKKAATEIGNMIGITGQQKISSFEVGKANITGETATISVSLKLSDGTNLTNNLSLVKGELMTKNGDKEVTLWQVDTIKKA